MFLTYRLFAPAFSSSLDLYVINCVGDNEYEPDVIEYSVDVGENDCENDCESDGVLNDEAACEVVCDVYVLSNVLCVEYEISCVIGDVLC